MEEKRNAKVLLIKNNDSFLVGFCSGIRQCFMKAVSDREQEKFTSNSVVCKNLL